MRCTHSLSSFVAFLLPSVQVVGEEILLFSLQNRAYRMPAAPQRTLYYPFPSSPEWLDVSNSEMLAPAFVRIRLWHHEKEKRLWGEEMANRQYTHRHNERLHDFRLQKQKRKERTGQRESWTEMQRDFDSIGNKGNKMTASWHRTWNFGHREVRREERMREFLTDSPFQKAIHEWQLVQKWENETLYHMRLMICGPVKRRARSRRDKKREKEWGVRKWN